MKNLVIAGNILADVLKTIECYPQEGKLTQIRSISQSVGGAVPNVSIDLAVLDSSLPIKAFGKVGRDDYGQFVVEEMQKAGVDVSDILVSDIYPTSFTDVMNVENGERTFFTLPGASADLRVEDFPLEKLDAAMLHLGYILLLDSLDSQDSEYGTKAAGLLHTAQEMGIKTSLDMVSEESDRYLPIVKPSLKYCNYLIINEIEAGKTVNISPRKKDGSLNIINMKCICEKLLEFGVRDKVIIHCPESGFCLSKNGNFTVIPSLDLPKEYIKGSTGAGDAYCAGVLYGLYNGYSDQRLLELGSLCAACNLSSTDSVHGMRGLEEVLKLESQFERKINIC